MAGTFQRGDARPVRAPVATASAFEVGDLIAQETDGSYTRASSQAWTTDLATTRAAFVAKFAGEASQAKDANKPIIGNGDALGYQLLIWTAGVKTYPVPAGTYKNGDLLGPAKQSGNLLEDQKLEVVGSEAQATHRVAGRAGVNPGVIEAETLSVRQPAARQS